MNLYAALASGFQEFIKAAICKENINQMHTSDKSGNTQVYFPEGEKIEV